MNVIASGSFNEDRFPRWLQHEEDLKGSVTTQTLGHRGQPRSRSMWEILQGRKRYCIRGVDAADSDKIVPGTSCTILKSHSWLVSLCWCWEQAGTYRVPWTNTGLTRENEPQRYSGPLDLLLLHLVQGRTTSTSRCSG